ncbi:PAS domain S-box protein [Aquabacterium sp. A7-Y]|uniref:PAS domain S-box protein n=1 Tax=Aquabacterium sp. A7-Y TaxID=1349605 RepID=UPI00223DCBB8|nr:PAS domain S-box protein [Aquabacterium sp. A7-Y]MCW7539356.1 PAS domain S-box protein [Aquabacterium sp. A7-Y]
MPSPERDDTSYEDTEQALRDSEGRFRRYFELGLIGMAISSPTKGCLEVNDRICEIFGYERDELLRMSWTELIHADDVAAAVERFNRVMAGEIDGYSLDERWIRKDGRVIHGTVSVKCLRHADGSVNYFVARLEDITERKRAEDGLRPAGEALEQGVLKRAEELMAINRVLRAEIAERERAETLLREANAKIETILDSITGQFFAMDAQWRFTYLNRPAREQMKRLGKDPVRLIGCTLWQEFDAVRNEDSLRRVMRERVPLTEELYDPPLQEWMENHVYPGADGGILVFQKYITDRKKAERALCRSQFYLAEAQRISHTGSGVWNVRTGEVFWSEETYRIYGFDPATTQPSTELFLRILHPEDLPLVQEVFEQAVEEKGRYALDFRIVRPDASVRDIHSEGHAILDDSGDVAEVLGTVMDVTERKQAEQALRKAQADLAHMTRLTMLGELTTSLAHELNQPLGAVVLWGATCLRWLEREVPKLDEACDAARQVVKAGLRAGEVIQRVRALMAQTVPQRDRLDISELIDEVLALLEGETLRRGITVRRSLCPDLPPVLGDRTQLQQVLLNLISNAMDAMAEVEGRSRELVLRAECHGPDEVLVAVQDSGVGLAPEVQERIFEAFFTTKARGRGLGLGLAISRSIVEQHGGHLRAMPNRGRGATLLFTLPVRGPVP